MSVQNFEIKKGRTYDITVVVAGIGSWTGLVAKMYLQKQLKDGAADLTLTGSINAGNNTITFPLTAANTSSLDLATYDHEVVIYKADKTIVYAPMEGLTKVKKPIIEDPTV